MSTFTVRLLSAYDCQVVAAVGDGPALRQALFTHRPDVAVVDVRLPPTYTDEGLAVAAEARRASGLPVLVLSQYVASATAIAWPQRHRPADRPDGVLANTVNVRDQGTSNCWCSHANR